MALALDRTLVIAPHPDDESIAAGGLLQRAIAAGGEVRVVFVTDGDNNPWPLRYLKKKLWITMLLRMVRAGDLRARDALAGIIEAFSPSTLVLPSAFDLHSDHRAISWLAHGAAKGRNVVTYLIHGHAPGGRVAFRLELSAEETARKRAAIECHQSQLVLSRSRFLSYARPVEEFHQAEFDMALESRLHDWSCAVKHAVRVVTHSGSG